MRTRRWPEWRDQSPYSPLVRDTLDTSLKAGSPGLSALERSVRSKANRPVLLLRESLAQSLLLLLGQVGGDDLEVVLPELVYHPLRRRRPAGQSKQRRGSLRDLLSYLLDEVIVDSNVGHRTRERSHPSPDRRSKEGDEEDQPEQETPEGSTHSARAGRAVYLAGRRLLVALGPADHSRVLEGDHLSLLQALQSDEHPVCPIGIVELQYRKRRHSHLSFLLGYTNAVTPERQKRRRSSPEVSSEDW